MTYRRRNAGVVCHDGLLFVVGGDDGSANLSNVEVSFASRILVFASKTKSSYLWNRSIARKLIHGVYYQHRWELAVAMLESVLSIRSCENNSRVQRHGTQIVETMKIAKLKVCLTLRLAQIQPKTHHTFIDMRAHITKIM